MVHCLAKNQEDEEEEGAEERNSRWDDRPGLPSGTKKGTAWIQRHRC
jgi:hypothetical protein